MKDLKKTIFINTRKGCRVFDHMIDSCIQLSMTAIPITSIATIGLVFPWQQCLSDKFPPLAWYFYDSNTNHINCHYWPGISMTAIHITSIATIGLLFLWQQYLSHQLQLLAGISITAIHITSIATIDLVFWVHLNVKMFIIGLWQVGFLAG
jgi:hypothetical protein